MDWTQLDWQVLERLRDGFLNGAAAAGAPYWRTRADLANYDLTYAERIGWKWDAVIAELRRRAWHPPASVRVLVDWGCGSGVAARRVLRAFGAGDERGTENFDTLLLWDHSQLARDYAAEVARREFPKLKIAPLAVTPPEPFVLVVSHVINELPPLVLGELLALARRAEAVLWVEPGTHADSRALVAVREQLRGDFRIVAPCTHEGACGLLAPDAARHWCHNFAEPPSGIFADSNWVKFGQRAGIDLRGLPYSFLVLEKKSAANAAHTDVQKVAASRVIGRVRFHKAHASICNCDAVGGVGELTFYKRSDPVLFKQMEKHPAFPPLYTWQREEVDATRISSGKPWVR